jgi:ribosomal protein S18 acetylase RimI-like enzyme
MYSTPGQCSDWPALARIIRETLPMSAEARSFLIRRCYHEMNVLRDGHRIAGFTLGAYDRRPALAYLDQIAVAPEYQGRSLGKRLLHEFEEDAQLRGCDRVALIVRRENHVARKLYESTGYRYDEIESNYRDAAYCKLLLPRAGVSPHARGETQREGGVLWRILSHVMYRILTRSPRDSFATK